MSTTENPTITYKSLGEQSGSYKIYLDGRYAGQVTSGVGGRWDAKDAVSGQSFNHCHTRDDAARSIIRARNKRAELIARANARHAAKNA